MHTPPKNLITAPPFCVTNRERILECFGTEALAQLVRMASEGDPLADAAIQEVRQATGDQRNSLEAGIRKGLRSLIDAPAAVRDLLEQVEYIPDWVNPESLQRGSEAYLTIGPLWTTISLGPGSLAHTYSSPTIAKVLMGTGNLKTSAPRRLQETATWSRQALRPGGLVLGADGYVQTLQVRLLHARVRAGMISKGWDTTRQGVPISQLDLVRTWLDFTYVPFSALQKVGITFAEDELCDLYHLWQRVAHLLGIEPRYFRNVTDQASAKHLLELIDTACAGPDDNSRQLTEMMLTAVGQILQPAFGVPENVSIDLMHSFCRLFHDADLGDAIGARSNLTQALLPVIADANRYQRHLERVDPSVRQQKMAATLQYFDKAMLALEGKTAYQSNLESVNSSDLPPSI